MEESKELRSLYIFLQGVIYFTIAIEVLMFVKFQFSSSLTPVLLKFGKIAMYRNIFYSKLFTYLIVIITSIGSKPQKNLDIDMVKHILVPLFIGFILFFGSGFILLLAANNHYWKTAPNILYIGMSFIGAILSNVGFDNISKIIKSNLLKDKFNYDNESFEQTKKLIDTEYSVNIPMRYYHKKRMNDGYLNITNPFRGTLLIGTPGSGKSFTVINSFIRQHAAKGFALVVYDFKYPDLAKITYYHYLLNKKKGKIANFGFNVINFSDVEYSRRINPLKREYIEVLADAMETSEALYESLQKGDREGGNASFFKTSAINFLTACIFFFSRYEDGKYSDLPHVLSFINRSYQEIFSVLFTEPELRSLLSPFKTAYDNKAFDQLEGQIGSLKIQISKLATKESFWIFSGDDFNLKVSDPKNPSYLLLANNPKTLNMNSALNALIINRLTRLLNTDGNLPTSLIIDESPTVYFHQIATVLSTARSKKVSVLLGLQEIPQLEEQYGRAISKTITSVIGNVVSGAARSKETLEWLQTIFGKVKQRKEGISIQQNRTTISLNEQMDYLIPASKISQLQAGSLVAQVAIDFGQEDLFSSTSYNCMTNLDLKSIKAEENKYLDLPKFYNFGITEQRERKLQANFERIYTEVDKIVLEYV